MRKETKFSFFWKVGQLWWLIFIPFFFTHWLSPLIAGIVAKKKKWILWGLYYLTTVVLLFVFIPSPESGFRDLIIGTYFFSWIACFIHSIVIAVRFVKIRIDQKLGRTVEKQEKLSKENRKKIEGLGIKHKKIMQIMLVEKKEIMDSYNNIDPVLQSDMLDILEMVETYIDYAKELMTKEEEIDQLIKKINVSQIDSRITQLNNQIRKTSSVTLKNEYLDAIDNYQKQKETYKEFIEKKKVIDIKLESNIAKLREIKYDLIELKYKVSENEKNNIFKKANELADDMNAFVQNLKDTSKELNL